MIHLIMTNKEVLEVSHGSDANNIRWGKAYVLNDDIMSAVVYVTDEDGVEICMEF